MSHANQQLGVDSKDSFHKHIQTFVQVQLCDWSGLQLSHFPENNGW